MAFVKTMKEEHSNASVTMDLKDFFVKKDVRFKMNLKGRLECCSK